MILSHFRGWCFHVPPKMERLDMCDVNTGLLDSRLPINYITSTTLKKNSNFYVAPPGHQDFIHPGLTLSKVCHGLGSSDTPFTKLLSMGARQHQWNRLCRRSKFKTLYFDNSFWHVSRGFSLSLTKPNMSGRFPGWMVANLPWSAPKRGDLQRLSRLWKATGT